MTFLVARIAQGQTITNLIPQIRIKGIGFNMVSRQKNISSPAIPASVAITIKNSFSPFPNLLPIARGGGMRAGVGFRWVKLGGDHSSAAGVRAKGISITTLRHLANLRRITLKGLTAKSTDQYRLNNLQSLVSAPSGTIVLFISRYPRVDTPKLFAAIFTSDGLTSMIRLALNRAIIIVLYSIGKRGTFLVSLAAIIASQFNRATQSDRIEGALPGAVFSISVIGVKFHPATFTDFCIGSSLEHT